MPYRKKITGCKDKKCAKCNELYPKCFKRCFVCWQEALEEKMERENTEIYVQAGIWTTKSRVTFFRPQNGGQQRGIQALPILRTMRMFESAVI